MSDEHLITTSDLISKTPDMAFSQDFQSSCSKSPTTRKLSSSHTDDAFFRGLKSSFTPNSIANDDLEPTPLVLEVEPTPFKAGTSLQLASSESPIDSATRDGTMVFKLSPSNSSTTPNELHQDMPWNELVTFVETSLDSPSKTGKRAMPPPLAEVKAYGNQATKRRRTVSNANMNKTPRLRPHQDVLWQEHFSSLIKFIKEHGHCHVHYTCGHSPGLSKWVQRQRYQYKLKTAGKKTTMTDERQHKLEEVGFVWDSHAATWEQRLNELAEYKKEHGDCRVPSTYPQNPQLAMWVKSQRRQFKLYREGLNSNLSEERLQSLNELGFTWELRSVNDISDRYF
ncbi:unnamed protein product [Cylindrotheca closterium]|uniref:Helicase-associated domain-containing protein n=1 Tax=Cylindrotheca closterium TaxID=2856 RepID=A0AAD2FMI5_9STRA|nr:unnamed protein product [Cylindrotheca closterium]